MALAPGTKLTRLLAAVPEQADGARSMAVVLNWRAALVK